MSSRIASVVVALLTACAACGDDDGPASSPDSGPGADVAPPPPPPDSGPIDGAGPDAGGPEPTDAPIKGPWVLRPTTTSVLVRWESVLAPDEVAVEYEPISGGAPATATGTARETVVTLGFGVDSRLVPEPDVPGTYFIDEVAIGGLEPATCYRYRVVGYEDEAHGRFCTMHAPTDHTTPIELFVIGDTNPSIGNTAGVLEHGELDVAELTLHLGDIQYYSSVIESWQSWFGLMEPLLRAGALMPTIGNHEDELDGELEDYYVRLFGGASEDGDEHRYHFESGGVHFFSLDSEGELGAGNEQATWLEAELAEAEASDGYRFSILYCHRPPYSVGGSSGSRSVRSALAPVVAAHTVPLVMSGHVHNYQRFDVDGVAYVVSGGGGGLLETVEPQPDQMEDAALRVAAGSYYHAIRLTIDETTIHGDVVDDAGDVRDSFDYPVP